MEATSTDGEMTIINMKVMCASSIHPSIIFLSSNVSNSIPSAKCQPTRIGSLVMVLFLLILGWSLLELLDRLLGQIDIQPAYKWWSDKGMLVVSPMLSQFLSYEKEKYQLLIVL